jgi:hypothetical protein
MPRHRHHLKSALSDRFVKGHLFLLLTGDVERPSLARPWHGMPIFPGWFKWEAKHREFLAGQRV